MEDIFTILNPLFMWRQEVQGGAHAVGSSRLCALPSLVSSAWQRLLTAPHSHLALQSPWQLVPVGAVRREGGWGCLFICLRFTCGVFTATVCICR